MHSSKPAAIAVVAMTFWSAPAPAAPPDGDVAARLAQLESKSRRDETRIAELEARLAAMVSERQQSWLTEQRADEIRLLVQDVLADADARSGRLAQGWTAGYDNGAVIASSDGNWMIRTNVLLQTRFLLSSMSDPGVPAGAGGFDGTTWGFEVTRARFDLTGNVVSPEWFYKVQVETSTNAAGLSAASLTSTPDARTGLLDAYVGYDFHNGVQLFVGQFKTPLLFEELTDDQHQQAVDRSLINYLFTGSRTQGVLVDYRGDQVRLRGSFNNGIDDGLYGGGVATSPPGGGALAPDTKWAATGRIDWLAAGTWDQFKDYTSPRGEEFGVLVGGAIHAQRSENDTGSPLPDVQLTVLTVDASAEFGGFNLFGSLVYANADVAGPADAKPWGIVIGGGGYVSDTWELFGRYEWSDPGTISTQNINLLTIGATKYFAGHNARWTTDVGVGLDAILPAVAGAGAGQIIAPAAGHRRDVTGKDGQVLIRSQLQVVF